MFENRMMGKILTSYSRTLAKKESCRPTPRWIKKPSPGPITEPGSGLSVPDQKKSTEIKIITDYLQFKCSSPRDYNSQVHF